MSETISDKIFESLSLQIVTGVLEAGVKLRQDHIARDFSTSHVPVREALLRLEARGLAESLPRRGTRVSALDPAEIREIVEMRVSLELLALSYAVPRARAADLEVAHHHMVACDRATDMATWDVENRAFHMAILAPCQMPRLLNSVEDLHLAAARHLFAHWQSRWRPRVDHDHAAIFQAIEQRDTGAACAALKRHLRRVG